MSAAQPVTLPPALGHGNSYRLVFLTSGTSFPGSSNVADYNAFVTAHANSVPELVALGTTWKAIASTATVDARDNTRTNPTFLLGVPMYRLDGVLVANINEDMWDGNLQAPIQVFENGSASGARQVFTGTGSNGRAAAGSELGTTFPMVGLTNDFTHPTWVELGGFDVLAPMHFYAVSDIITVPPVPNPTWLQGALAACLATSGIAWSARRS